MHLIGVIPIHTVVRSHVSLLIKEKRYWRVLQWSMWYGTQLQSYLPCGPLCTEERSHCRPIIFCFKHQWATFCRDEQAPLLRLKSRIKRKLLYLLQSVMDTGSNFWNPEEGAEGRWPELQTTISVTSVILCFTGCVWEAFIPDLVFSDDVGYNGALSYSSDVDMGESLTSTGRHKIFFVLQKKKKKLFSISNRRKHVCEH